jgi:EmrB/QacA subfamily drug resistance transporter
LAPNRSVLGAYAEVESTSRRIEGGFLFGKRKSLLVFMATMLGISLAPFTLGMIGTALPQIVTDLGGVRYSSWVVTAYLLTTAVTVPLWGKLCDIYGRRGTYTASLFVFTAGALVCGFAHTMPLLIAGRLIAGIGAGGMVPISATITADLISPRERAKWIGVSQVLFSTFSIGAPAIGGWITDLLGWRWTFYSVGILGAVALVVAWLVIRIEIPSEKKTLDYVGAGLVMVGACTLLLAIVWGGDVYAWSSPVILGLLASSAVLLLLFGVWEARIAEPIFPLSLFGNRTFAAAQVGIVGIHVALLATMTYAPMLVQGILGVTASEAGLLMLANGVTLMLAGLLVGFAVSHTGRFRGILLASPVLLAIGCIGLMRLDLRSTVLEAMLYLVILGVGTSLSSGTLIVVVQNAVSARVQGVASAGMAFTRLMGATIGVAIVGAVLNARVAAELATRVPGARLDGQTLNSLFTGGTEAARSAGFQQLREAFQAGAPGAFAVVIPLLAVSFVAMLFIESRELRPTVAEPVLEPLLGVEVGEPT